MILPRPGIGEIGARAGSSEAEPAEQNHAAGVRIERHRCAVALRWVGASAAASLRPISSIKCPGIVDETDLIDKSTEEHDLVIDRIVRHRGVVTRRRLMRRLQLRPSCAGETPGAIQYSVRRGGRVAPEENY